MVWVRGAADLVVQRADEKLRRVNLVPELVLLLPHLLQELVSLGRVIVEAGRAPAVHDSNHLAAVVGEELEEVFLQTSLTGLVHDVTVSRRREREGNLSVIGPHRNLDTGREDWRGPGRRGRGRGDGRATAPTTRRPVLILSHTGQNAWIVSQSALKKRSGRRGTHLNRYLLKKRGIRLTRALMSLVHQLCVQSSLGVKGATAVETEAVGVAAIEPRVTIQMARRIAEPNLDIPVAEEVHLRCGATRDTANKTAALASCTVLEDLRGGHVVDVGAGHFLLGTS